MEAILLISVLLNVVLLWDIRCATRKTARAVDFLAKVKEEERRYGFLSRHTLQRFFAFEH